MSVLVTVLQVQALLNHRVVTVYIRNHIGGQQKWLCRPHFAPGTQICHAGDNFLRFVNGACAGQVNPTPLKVLITLPPSHFDFIHLKTPAIFNIELCHCSDTLSPLPISFPLPSHLVKNKLTLLSSLTYSLLFSSNSLSLLRTLHYSCGVSKLCNSCRGATWAPSFTT